MFTAADPVATATTVRMEWGVTIPLRDGVNLHGTLYLPRNLPRPKPAIVTITPYISQTWHQFAAYFAGHGYPFLAVDARGRGNSEGAFRPLLQEAADGYDVVEWLARQPYCTGQVAMWGGSYAGYNQWATAASAPPHLATVVPVAALYVGVDFPCRNNIAEPYWMRWLTLVSGRTAQDQLYFNSDRFWAAQFLRWFESGVPFRRLDAMVGNPSATFQEWVSHPAQDTYWDAHNPTAAQYRAVSVPVLSITGMCDGDQPGVLKHYLEHTGNVAPHAAAEHYLVIGPWDHAGTRSPRARFCGMEFGPASLVDLPRLHVQWYGWTMESGPRPDFLRDKVAYYVTVAERWRYADTLDAVTAYSQPLHLRSTQNPTDVFHSGRLTWEPEEAGGGPDCYLYDPRDMTLAELETRVDPTDRTDQRLVLAMAGRHLVYHSPPFAEDQEVSGFFRFSAWIAIDQPDTDIRVSVYDVALDGTACLLTTDSIRARYRQSLRDENLISTEDPLLYDFDAFGFVSRLVRAGHRLRLVVGPVHSIYRERNHNSGGVVADESLADARPVRVSLLHDAVHPTALFAPLGRPAEQGKDH
jgi:putative CocE/NonD family hydrolase